jgi:MOSC domain-containing protein YiiM
MIMSRVVAVCRSSEKGTPKVDVCRGYFKAEFGLDGDAHAGQWGRQVSLLSADKIEAFNRMGANVPHGAFGENLVVEGLDFRSLPVGAILRCGDVLLEITQIGKECHSHCEIYKRMGDCIMPREGVFARVLESGVIAAGDEMTIFLANE